MCRHSVDIQSPATEPWWLNKNAPIASYICQRRCHCVTVTGMWPCWRKCVSGDKLRSLQSPPKPRLALSAACSSSQRTLSSFLSIVSACMLEVLPTLRIAD